MNLTYVVDVAGRVTRDADGAQQVTAGGVCLPGGALKSIRKRLPSAFPKWRDASDTDVAFVVDLLRRESFSVAAMVVNKTAPKWRAFWDNAGSVHAKTSGISRGTVSFVKAATQIKYLLLAQTAVIAGAHSIRTNSFPRPRRKDRPLVITEQHIYDNEIDGPDNREAFQAMWDARNLSQPLTAVLGVEMRAESIDFKTPTEEPLLLLADYVAGIAHAKRSTTNTLSRSNVSCAAAESAHSDLSAWPKYTESIEDFAIDYFEIFPDFKVYAPNAA